MRAQGLKPTPFAKEAGLAPSTLLRALDPETPTTLERGSISKIINRFAVPGPYVQQKPTSGPGFSEPDLAPLDDAPQSFLGAALAPNQYLRAVRSRALELAGYLPGDIVLFDMGVPARSGDAVDANLYSGIGAETVFRVYEAPYIVTRTMDASARAKPLLVDEERVRIMATCIASLRKRL